MIRSPYLRGTYFRAIIALHEKLIMTHIVYWLFNEFCNNPSIDGYIGVTKNFPSRLSEHRKRFNSFDVVVLFEGTEEQCYTYELQLRPHPSIGWNHAPGGPEGYKRVNGGHKNKGKVHTIETKLKFSLSHRGKKQSPEQIEKRMLKIRGRPSPKQSTRLKLEWSNGTRSPTMTGHTHSEKTKLKMSEAQTKAHTEGRGNRRGFQGCHTEETKAKLRAIRLRQPDPRLGTKHSEKSRQKMRLAALKRPRPQDRKTGRFI